MNYFMLQPLADEDGNLLGFEIEDDDIEDKNFHVGEAFVEDAGAPLWKQVPRDTIVLKLKKGRESASKPSYLSQPLPIISDEFYRLLLDCGVSNLQAFNAQMIDSDGNVHWDEFKVVNIVGVARPEQNPENLKIFRLPLGGGASVFVDEDIRDEIQRQNLPCLEAGRFEIVELPWS